MKLNRRLRTQTKINSLLIDGEALLKQGFHGAKQVQTKNGSVGTIFHFINTIKRFYQDYGVTKVVVFWEGENSKAYRQAYYPYYKQNRNDKVTIDQKHDLDRQRVRIKQYLEELFIRQVEIDGCEADDCIAYYVKNSPNESKTIYTNDRDLLQLMDDETKVFLHGKKIMINVVFQKPYIWNIIELLSRNTIIFLLAFVFISLAISQYFHINKEGFQEGLLTNTAITNIKNTLHYLKMTLKLQMLEDKF